MLYKKFISKDICSILCPLDTKYLKLIAQIVLTIDNVNKDRDPRIHVHDIKLYQSLPSTASLRFSSTYHSHSEIELTS